MKRYLCAIISLFTTVCLLTACQNNNQSAVRTDDSTVTDTMVNADTAETFPATLRPVFELNSIPQTTFDLGAFPFFPAPKGYVYRNVKMNPVGEEYFLADGKLTAVEGKSFKAELVKEEPRPTATFSISRVEKAYDTMIELIGGVKVSNDIPTKAEMERIGDTEIYDKERGFTVGFGGIELNTYVLRNRGAEVWVQLSMNKVYGAICIIQKGDFISSVKRSEIKKALSESSHIDVDLNNDSVPVQEEADSIHY